MSILQYMSGRREKVEILMEGLMSLRRRMMVRESRVAAAPRITPAQWAALTVIDTGGTSTVKDVARLLGISSSAATQLIDGLSARGYVVREPHSIDRRMVALVLPQNTKKHIEKIKRESTRNLLNIFKVLNEKEFDQFIMLTTKVVERSQ